MKRSAFALALSLAATFAVMAERDASACGGCFHPPTQTQSDITDERMLLSVSTQQSTLYDQIRYSGSPTSFAWVLPIHGTVDVGLSADVLFDSVDSLTETTIIPPEQNCPPPPPECLNNSPSAGFGGGSNGSGADAGAAPPSVTVTKAQNVGPYETVQLHSTDASALEDWLAQNGFSIPDDVKPIIAQYVTEGFDFLAMKLLPDQGVQAMRPVRVTAQGASLSLPLRMAAIGTGATVGITIWTVSDGRYEPQNFPFFHIEDSELVWDWSTNLSNYTTLRVEHEATLQGKGWEMESSLTLNQQVITNLVLSGGQLYGGGFGGGQTADAGDDYLPTNGADAGADGGGAGTGETADQVRADDLAALFAGMAGPNVRVTRMRSDIAHAAMTTDFILKASADQSELSNQRIVTNQVNLQCPVYDNCQVVGSAPSGPQAAAATAANSAANGGTNNGKSSFSCDASPKRASDLGVRFGIPSALFGLFLVRAMRRRRNRK